MVRSRLSEAIYFARGEQGGGKRRLIDLHSVCVCSSQATLYRISSPCRPKGSLIVSAVKNLRDRHCGPFGWGDTLNQDLIRRKAWCRFLSCSHRRKIIVPSEDPNPADLSWHDHPWSCKHFRPGFTSTASIFHYISANWEPRHCLFTVLLQLETVRTGTDLVLLLLVVAATELSAARKVERPGASLEEQSLPMEANKVSQKAPGKKEGCICHTGRGGKCLLFETAHSQSQEHSRSDRHTDIVLLNSNQLLGALQPLKLLLNRLPATNLKNHFSKLLIIPK